MRVRLTHPLGRNDFDLDYRAIDDPVVIGRATEADLQVPSIAVGRSHAVLFVHEGAWVVQDSGTKEGTYRNGKKLTGPKVLKKGDVILLGEGDKAPRIDILDLDAAAPASPLPAVAASVVAEPPFDAPEVAVMPAPPRPRGKPKSTVGRNIFFGVAVLVILGGIGLGAWGVKNFTEKQRLAEEARNAKPKVVVVNPAEQSQRKTIFQEASRPAASPAASPAPSPAPPAAPAVVPPPPPPSAPVTPSPAPIDNTGNAVIPDDPPRDGAVVDPQWSSVLEFRDSSPPVVAIYQFLLYRTQNPQSPNLKALDQMQTAALDQLWWQRLNDLVAQQKAIDAQIEELKKEKSELPREATKDRRDQFDRQVKDLQSSREANRLLLEGDMGYKLLVPVDLNDEAAVEKQRKARDVAVFERWSQRTLARIRSTRGASAW